MVDRVLKVPWHGEKWVEEEANGARLFLTVIQKLMIFFKVSRKIMPCFNLSETHFSPSWLKLFPKKIWLWSTTDSSLFWDKKIWIRKQTMLLMSHSTPDLNFKKKKKEKKKDLLLWWKIKHCCALVESVSLKFLLRVYLFVEKSLEQLSKKNYYAKAVWNDVTV